MYRVQSAQDYPPVNQNLANLAGALWYLHNEIVIEKGHRRWHKTRIQRFKVTMQATQPLSDDGMNFGVRFAFDRGSCTGPWNCKQAFEKYGYFVGCNYVDQWPTQQWKGKVFYPYSQWYSMPGPCSSRLFSQHTRECELTEPGGECDHVNGKGDCTFSTEYAGDISIDELEGIESFEKFAAEGGWEYNNKTDRGVHMTFWDNKFDTGACIWRMNRAQQLFHAKYPWLQTEAELPAPPCDFKRDVFYQGLQQS